MQLVFSAFERLIIGGQDGSVTFLVVAHNLTSEQRDETRAVLKRLPSRKRQKRHLDEEDAQESAGHTDSSDSFLNRELEKKRLQKLKVRRKFRYIWLQKSEKWL